MYDNHIFSREYGRLKNIVVNIVNGDDEKTDVDELKAHIHELYADGELQATQYDDLMRYLDDWLC